LAVSLDIPLVYITTTGFRYPSWFPQPQLDFDIPLFYITTAGFEYPSALIVSKMLPVMYILDFHIVKTYSQTQRWLHKPEGYTSCGYIHQRDIQAYSQIQL
jgi:hypothetical protein